MHQTRFMCWNNRKHISVIDINADPFIEEIIEIPEDCNEKEKLSYEVAAATIPFLDISPYTEPIKKKNDDNALPYPMAYGVPSSIEPKEKRIPGISNFFKAKLRHEPGDLKSRLKRMHRVLKKAWYLDEKEKTIEHMIAHEKELEGQPHYTKIYEQLFTIDFVTFDDKYLIE